MTSFTEYPTLKNAPITEAVIDVRVSRPAASSGNLLASLRSRFIGAFPLVEEQRTVEGIVALVDGRVHQSVSDQGGQRVVMRSEDRQEAVIISDTGFGFSKLRPYTRWGSVFSSARCWWDEYAAVADIAFVSRAAVRYINHFNVPAPEISARLQTPPNLPEGVRREEVTNVLSRLHLRDPETEIETVVLQIVDWSGNDASVLIDIDASLSGKLKPADEKFWEIFEKLRAAKNRTFFGSITTFQKEELNR